MNGVNDWILGGVTAILAVIGLYVASHAHDEVGYYGGLIFFIAVDWIFAEYLKH